MAQNEPIIPVMDGDKIVDETIEKQPVKDQTPDKAGASETEKGATPTVSEEQYKNLMEGWKEDREYFNSEIKKLRGEAKNPHLTEIEEDELEGLTEKERVEKIIKFRDERKVAVEEAELKAVKSEIRFFERTDKLFADNKKEILKVATDYNSPSLSQAMLIWKGLTADKVRKDAQYHDERKKGADGKGGGSAAGKPAGKPYDAKADANKSYGDFYRGL